MCGIIGVFGAKDASKLVSQGLKALENRGRDGKGQHDGENFSIGHCLHSVVGRVKQPLTDSKNIFSCNCEIYNWKELAEKSKVGARNDAELIFHIIKDKGVNEEVLDTLDGVYALAYHSKGKLWLARDILGVKPLWYSHTGGFFFASEKKTLEQLGVINVQELNPRKILEYDTGKDKLLLHERKFFPITPETREKISDIKKNVQELIRNAVKKRVPKRKFGLLFSGGIDSTVIAMMLKKLGAEFTCYTAVLDDPTMKEPEDLSYATRIAKELKLDHKIIKIPLSKVESYLKIIVPLIEDSNVVKAGVALPFYAACEEAGKDGCKVLFSGLGSEEIFAGYERHRESQNVNSECVSGLLKMYERDLYRDDVVTMHNSIELRLTFLDTQLVRYSLTIPEKHKISKGREKYILRLVAGELGLLEEYAMRKKKAAQYGSNFHKALDKLARKAGCKTKSEYLRRFYPAHNLKLGALISTGKDSIYAAYTMIRQNYAVKCFITLESKNPDSYMFHTPTIKLAKLQSEAAGIPLVLQETIGEKEKELDDLKAAIAKAREKYGIEGIITGALFSNYQRERIEKTCDELSLKIFSPLWHINQETEMREIIRSGFEFIMTKVAAEGLNSGWLGKKVDDEAVDKLVVLKEKIGLNVAGEGGEFETLVLDCPIFRKKITILDFWIKREDENTATLFVKDAKLSEKGKT